MPCLPRLCVDPVPGGPDTLLHGLVSADRRAPAHPGVQHHRAACTQTEERLTICPAGGEGEVGRGRRVRLPALKSRGGAGGTLQPKPQQP